MSLARGWSEKASPRADAKPRAPPTKAGVAWPRISRKKTQHAGFRVASIGSAALVPTTHSTTCEGAKHLEEAPSEFEVPVDGARTARPSLGGALGTEGLVSEVGSRVRT